MIENKEQNISVCIKLTPSIHKIGKLKCINNQITFSEYIKNLIMGDNQ